MGAFSGTSFSSSSFSVDSVIVLPAESALEDAALQAIDYEVMDHQAEAIRRLPHQYLRACDGSESNMIKLLRVWLTPAADLERAILDVMSQLNIDFARGQMLTFLGKWVGRERNGVTDDDIFRRYVRAQISANKSDGTQEDILGIARLVIDDDDAEIILDLDIQGPAAYTLQVDGVGVTIDVVTVLVQLVIKATSAGVRPLIQWAQVDSPQVFRYDSGPGYDIGHYSTATNRSL